jgi:hypothetical protein
MTGWNLPPGCSTRDLPGNRPEDEAGEAFYDSFYEMEEEARKAHPEMGDDYVEALCAWAWKRFGEAYGEGYQEGGREERSHQEQLEIEKAAEEWRSGKAPS